MFGQFEVFIEILLTILFGAILGLETETREIEQKGKIKATRNERERIGGVRTYTVISLFGGIAGLFFSLQEYTLVYILFIAIIGLILSAYILNVQIKHAFGLTTEIAVLIAFILGFLTTSRLVEIWVVLVILVMLAFFLSQKRGIGLLINKIQHKEVIDVVKFSLVALVILPILPNTSIKIIDIARLAELTVENQQVGNITLLNPFNTWLIVVLVSGINLFGYFLSRIVGTKRGLLLTAAISGFISSTSAIISFAAKSKTKENKNNGLSFAGAAMISNSFSFFTISLLMFVNSKQFFIKGIWPFVIMFVVGIIIGLVFLYRNKGGPKNSFEIKYEPFSVFPAIKFVLIIVGLTLLIQFLQLFQVNQILVLGITALSGFTGMDAATIAFSNLSKDGLITVEIGIISLILANAINFLAKILYSLIGGSKQFFRKVTLGLVLSAIIGLLGLLLMNLF